MYKGHPKPINDLDYTQIDVSVMMDKTGLSRAEIEDAFGQIPMDNSLSMMQCWQTLKEFGVDSHQGRAAYRLLNILVSKALKDCGSFEEAELLAKYAPAHTGSAKKAAFVMVENAQSLTQLKQAYDMARNGGGNPEAADRAVRKMATFFLRG